MKVGHSLRWLLALAVLSAVCSCSQQEPTKLGGANDAVVEDILELLESFTSQAGLPATTDPVITITNPSGSVPPYIQKGVAATPVTVTYSVTNWSTFPASGKSVNCYLDGGTYVDGAVQLGTPDGSSLGTTYEFSDVPEGQHQLCCTLAQDGTDLKACGATACVTVRITQPCTSVGDPVCDDGNPCSVDACVDGFCRYGYPLDRECCLSRFDCGCNNGFWEICDDSTLTCVSCKVDGDCDDNESCTDDSCDSQNQCHNVWRYDESDRKCCHAGMANEAQVCNDGKYCTVDFCDTVNGYCVNGPNANPACCENDQDPTCDDGNVCTLDRCVGHICRHGPVPDPLCCNDAGECDDGNPCTDDSCNPETNQCEYVDNDLSDCCDVHTDCGTGGEWDDGQPNTLDYCVQHQCVHQPNPLYCDDSGNFPCNPDSNICTVNQCVNHLCKQLPIDGCCNLAKDCDDKNACSLDTCVNNECVNTVKSNCCLSDGQCDDDNPCTVDACVNHVCRHGPDLNLPNCCQASEDCDDGIECTVEYCDLTVNECARSLLTDHDPQCCFIATECDDGDPLTIDKCTKNECQHAPDLTICDEAHPSCEDYNPCTQDSCNFATNKCNHVVIEDCCLSDYACTLPGMTDGNPCTQDVCDLYTRQCTFVPRDNCCTFNGDPACDDGDPCTADRCLNYTCRHLESDPNCCADDTDCADKLACTVNTCVKDNPGDATGSCDLAVDTSNPECCDSSADCYDNDNCTTDNCVNYHCEHESQNNCCIVDAECDDMNPCTCDSCIFGTCRHVGPDHAGPQCNLPPLCCVDVGDCDSDNNPCTLDQCIAGVCTYEPMETCSLPLPYVQDFNTAPNLTQLGWSYVDKGAASRSNWKYVTAGDLGPDKHYRFDYSPLVPTAFDSYLITPALLAGSASYVTVQYEHQLSYYSGAVQFGLYVVNDNAEPIGTLTAADQFNPVWVPTPVTADEDAGLVQKTIPTSLLSDQMHVAFEVASANSYNLNFYDLDNIRICAGRSPYFVAPLTQIASKWDASSVFNYTIKDPDGGSLTFNIISGPDFLSLKAPWYNWVKQEWTLGLLVSGASQEDIGDYEVIIEASDGCLSKRVVINLTVLVSNGYLVWVPTGIPDTQGQAILDSIKANGRVAQLVRDLGMFSKLDGLAGVFVSLGVYGGPKYILSNNSDLKKLTDYLNGGGNVYLEGGDTWALDTVTNLHPYFNIKGLSDGPQNYPGPVVGKHFCWSEDFDVSSSFAVNNFIDHIDRIPTSGAIPILADVSGSFSLAVSFEDATTGYRTIGSSLPLAALVDGGGTLDGLVAKYLDFFENGYPPCTVNQQCDDSIICTDPDSCAEGGVCSNPVLEGCTICLDDRDCGEDQACQLDTSLCGPLTGDRFDSSAEVVINSRAIGTYTSVISVSEMGLVDRVNVKLRISHAYIGDLNISLAHNGTTVQLKNANGADNSTGLYYTYDFGTDVYSGSAYDMADFQGMGENGDWTLAIQDISPISGGKLLGWSLYIDKELIYCEDDTPCNDGDICTIDFCGGDSYCQIMVNTCEDEDDGHPNLCTVDSCDPDLGCVNEPVDCDDSNICTTDSCDTLTGECVNDLVQHCVSPCTHHSDCGYDDYCDVGEGVCKPIPGTPYYAAGAFPIKIPDTATSRVANSIQITGTEFIRDAQVKVKILHPYRSDLTVSLSNGTKTLMLHDRSGGAADNVWMVYDIADLPDGPGDMSTFDGLLVEGTWTLTVTDWVTGDKGTLESWTLYLTKGLCYSDDNCDDGNVCTVDLCDLGVEGGACSNTLLNCDDGLWCNGTETCDSASGCVSGDAPVVSDGVDCTTDFCDEANDQIVHQPMNAACDDGQWCNGTETCDALLGCQSGAAPVVDDGVPCTLDQCDEDGNVVLHLPDNSVCNDGVWCNGVETCSPGVEGLDENGCLGGAAVEIDDGVACTVDLCDEDNRRVTHTADHGLCPNDGLWCNGAEVCDAEIGCTHSNPPVGGDDGVSCTVALCDEDNDTWIQTPDNGLCADDGQFCNGVESCDAVLGCVHSSAPAISDGIPCTLDSCDNGLGSVVHTPDNTQCNDDNPCTDDVCTPGVGCVFTPNTAACDDGDVCTTGDACSAGSCQSGSGVNPACEGCTGDGDCPNDADLCNGSYTCSGGVCVLGGVVTCPANSSPCLENVCNPVSGACSVQFKEQGISCNDSDPCTSGDVCDDSGNCEGSDKCDDGLYCNGAETCEAGTCGAGAAIAVDDGVSCTQDYCDEDLDTVVHTPNSSLCDNGTYCDGVETCDATLGCVAGAPVAADDGISCTEDLCDEDLDKVTHVANSSLCDNDLYCDGVETCSATLGCIPGTPPVEDDGVACTEAVCNEATDSIDQIPNHELCDDGDDCDLTGTEYCDAQLDCQPGPPVAIDDGIPCTVDSCVAGQVQHVPNNAACDDGFFCNGAEVCTLLGCVNGTAPAVDDGIVCTIDACDENLNQIVHTADNSQCNDGQFCNGVETCNVSSGCVSSAAPDCDDGSPCTNDVCDSSMNAGHGACDNSEQVEYCTSTCGGSHPFDAGDDDCGYGDACVGGVAGEGLGVCTPICDGANCGRGSSGIVDLPITDNKCVTHTINVTAPNAYIVSADIKWEILHSYLGDVSISIWNPGAPYWTEIWKKGTGADNANMANTMTASYPSNVFNFCSLQGAAARGQWRISVCDGGTGNTGILKQWSVEVSTSAENLSLGNTCETAIPMNSADGTRIWSGETTCATNYYTGSCGGGSAPDRVYKFSITKPTKLTASVAGDQDYLLYLRSADGTTCSSVVEGNLACATEFTAHLNTAGTYYLIVDGATAADKGEYAITTNFLSLLDNGRACTQSDECLSSHCQNGFCCASGDCCNQASACPGSYSAAAVCTDASLCEGSRVNAVCNSFQCSSSTVVDDSACEGELAATCGCYDDIFCTADVNQPTPACPVACTDEVTDSECDASCHCDGVCTSDLANGEACNEASDCISAHCQNGFCCADGACCMIADECPDESFGAAPVCDSPGTCQGHREDKICASNQCGETIVEDDSACLPSQVANECGFYKPVYCTGALDQTAPVCPTSCTTDDECDADARCDGVCLGKAANGEVCDEDSDCASSHCQNGFCCDEGDCCAVKANCPASYVEPLSCDDGPTCQGHFSQAACVNNSCQMDSVNDDRGCSTSTLADSCGLFKSVYCTGEVNQTTPDCPTSCTTEAECDDTAHCDETCVLDLVNGSACDEDTDCISAHCQNGFCCDEGDCCVAESDCPASFELAPVCDDSVTCQGHRLDKQCVDFQCGSNEVTDDSACDSSVQSKECGCYPDLFCSGEANQSEPLCATSCDNDTDVPCKDSCHCDDSDCTADLELGAACDESSDCASGFCVDNVCCNAGCDGVCVACNLEGLEGTCSPFAINTDPENDCFTEAAVCSVCDGAGACMMVPAGEDPLEVCTGFDANTCMGDGFCDGAGSCRNWAAGTECQAQSCSAHTKYLVDLCDGDGTCADGGSVDCAPYVCAEDAVNCLISCDSDDDCVAGFWCDAAGACVAKHAHTEKAPCDAALSYGGVGAPGNQCISGFCVDGYCCNETCDGSCRTCAKAAVEGTCSFYNKGLDPEYECGDQCGQCNGLGACEDVPEGEDDPWDRCLGTAQTTCGLDGTCDGSGECRYWTLGTLCLPEQSCTGTDGRMTDFQTNAGTCDGGGICIDNGTTECYPYACNGTWGCYSSCSANTHCASDSWCDGSVCFEKKANGRTCSGPTAGFECQSGFCVDGVCCDGACNSDCESCNQSGNKYGLSFDGSTKALSDGATALVEAGLGQSVTFELWFRPDGVMVEGDPIGTVFAASEDDFFGDGLDAFRMKVDQMNGDLYCEMRIDNRWVYVTYATVDLAEWNHVAVVYDYNDQTAYTYVNGAFAHTEELPASQLGAAVNYLALGYYPMDMGDTPMDEDPFANEVPTGDGQRFVGDVAEVRIWDVARSYDDVIDTMDITLSGSETGLVGLWKFTENGGQVTMDAMDAHGFVLGDNGSADDEDPEWIEIPELAESLASSKGQCLPYEANTDPENDCGDTCSVCDGTGGCTFALNGTDPNSDCPTAAAHTCAGDGFCDGSGACRLYASGTVCGASICFPSANTYYPQKQCNGLGVCRTFPLASCAPYKCANNVACATTCSFEADCLGAFHCNVAEGLVGECVADQANGTECSEDRQCQSQMCVDGFCCATACDGLCESCAVVPGTCSPIPENTDPDNDCTDVCKVCSGVTKSCIAATEGTDPGDDCVTAEPGSCGFDGLCAADAQCRFYGPSVECAPQSCSEGTIVQISYCDQAGSCQPGAEVSCNGFQCTGDTCRTTCAGDSECMPTFWCDTFVAADNQCKPKFAIGDACDQSNQCGSSFCVDGVCCDTGCSGTCALCNAPGMVGTCTYQGTATDPESECGFCEACNGAGACTNAAANTDIHEECAVDSGNVCGQNGFCDGSGACMLSEEGTNCGIQSCSGYVLTPWSSCDGIGNCDLNPDVECEAYMCNAAGNDCRTSCDAHAHCREGFFCASSHACLPKRFNGDVCEDDNSCLGAHCVDGICCDTSCDGGCEACNMAWPLSSISIDGSLADWNTYTQRLGTGVADIKYLITWDADYIYVAWQGVDLDADNVYIAFDKDRSADPASGADTQWGGLDFTSGARKPDYAVVFNTSNNIWYVPATGSSFGLAEDVGSWWHYKGWSGNKTSELRVPRLYLSGLDPDAGFAVWMWVNNNAETFVWSVWPDSIPVGDAPRSAVEAQFVKADSGMCKAVDRNTDPLFSCGTCRICDGLGACMNAAALDDPKEECPTQTWSTVENMCPYAGYCNGNGACAPYPAGTACKDSSLACVGDSTQVSFLCDATAHCVAQGALVKCAGGYMCNDEGTACLDACADTSDCQTGYYCQGSVCTPKKAQGQTCTFSTFGNDECLSGFCVDGYCCNNACDLACEACNKAGSQGTCSLYSGNTDPDGDCPDCQVCSGVNHACVNSPAGTDIKDNCEDAGESSCGTDGTCDGLGACTLWPSGTVCSAAYCSVAGDMIYYQHGAQICDGDGTCADSSVASCGLYKCSGAVCATTCTVNTDCLSTAWCNGDGQCELKLPLGNECSANSQCQSDKCIDGYCCNMNCNGVCQACDVAGRLGQCTNAPNNTDPENECGTCGVCTGTGMCKAAAAGTDPKENCLETEPAGCLTDGMCNGAWACRKWGTSTLCAEGSCSDTTYQPDRFCSGTGTCTAVAPQSCAPYVCNVAGSYCLHSCQTNAECVADAYCDGTVCQPQKATGMPCNEASECESNFCIDGFCCDGLCDGTCETCGRTGLEGTCSPAEANTDPDLECGVCDVCDGAGACTAVADGEDPLGQCAQQLEETCLQDGYCDGAGECRNWVSGTVCLDQSCTDGVVTQAQTCDGAGSCDFVGYVNCAAYTCDDAGVSCRTGCTESSHCATGFWCNGNVCQASKLIGESCTSASECGTGNCVDGVCCDSGCDQLCASCNLPYTKGYCTSFTFGRDPEDDCGVCQVCNGSSSCVDAPVDTDPEDECLTELESSCGSTGVCDGAGECKLYPASTQCLDPYCQSATLTAASFCDGVGACVSGADSSCSGYACAPTGDSCLTECNTNSDCIGSYYCSAPNCLPKKGLGEICSEDSQCGSNHCADGVCCNTACNQLCESCDQLGVEGTCTPFALDSDPDLECGTCRVCNGNGGCKNAAAGADPKTECTASAAESCGLDGDCDGVGACRFWDTLTSCASAECGGFTIHPEDTCDGAGTCVDEPAESCCPYVCDGTSACKSSCSVDSECCAGFFCNGSACVAKKSDGETCTGTSECESGFCVDGYCCNTGCTGSCRACNVESFLGTCTNLTAGSDPADECPTCKVCNGAGACVNAVAGTDVKDECSYTDPLAAPADWCGNNGSCNGSGACAYWPSSTLCSTQSCSGYTLTIADTCNQADGQCINQGTMNCPGGYICEDAESCKTSCTTSADCRTGFTCNGSVCEGQFDIGDTCTLNSDCLSNFCVDGFCCNNACDGLCEACNVAGVQGTCTDHAANTDPDNDCAACNVCDGSGACVAVTDGTDPIDDCEELAESTCGTDGTCLSGACANWDGSTECGEQSCFDGVVTLGVSCNGDGSACPEQGTQSCNGFRCADATSCKVACDTDDDCMATHFCDDGLCAAKKANGEVCVIGTECASSFCADGVCCSDACNGECQACDVEGMVGECTFFGNNADPENECGICNVCNGAGSCKVVTTGEDPKNNCTAFPEASCFYTGACEAGACQMWDTTTVCRAQSCLAGMLQPEDYCSGTGTCVDSGPAVACPGSAGCQDETSCTATCVSHDECDTGYYCNGGICTPKKENGQTCNFPSFENNECLSDFCVDGYCCNSGCTGSCRSCARTGSLGVCSYYQSGSDPENNCTECQYCNGAGSCTNVPVDTDPLGDCQATSESTCGNNGLCDGSGACSLWDAATICQVQECVGNSLTEVGQCDGSGTCADGGSVDCCPFICSGNACRTTCDGDDKCCAGAFCLGSVCVEKLANGEVCSEDRACDSGNCVDGVCCDFPCDGECVSCSVTGFVGTCKPLPSGSTDSFCTTCEVCNGAGSCMFASAGTDPGNHCSATAEATCGADGNCDGSGACRLWPEGTECVPASCSGGSNYLSLGWSCDGLGSCNQPEPDGQTCCPFACNTVSDACKTSCTTATDCCDTAWCDKPGEVPGTCRAKKTNGSACSVNSECNSDFCVDGVCCNTACDGDCSYCSSSGTCTPYANDTDPDAECGACRVCNGSGACKLVANGLDPKNDCAFTEPSTCGTDGACNGAGACRLYAATVACGDAKSCSGSTFQPQEYCSGSGACVDSVATNCCPYNCGIEACRTICSLDSHCCDGYYCSNSACISQKTVGQACNNDGQCATGFCVDGYCCDGACDGDCESCNQAGKLGTCSALAMGIKDPAGNCGVCEVCSGTNSCVAVPVGDDPHNECVQNLQTTCGYSGACDGTGACDYWGTDIVCESQHCDSNSRILHFNDTCDGVGSCTIDGGTQDCFPYRCFGGSCLTSCAVNGVADCFDQETYFCNSAYVCEPKRADGTACAGSGQCLNGYCVDGVCCDTACDGSCESCKADGSIGTCTVFADFSDPEDECDLCKWCVAGVCENVPAGVDDLDDCNEGARCGGRDGTCNGAGQCRTPWPEGSVCAPQACSGSTLFHTDTCDTSGHCIDFGTETCSGGYMCHSDGINCRTSCSSDSECQFTFYCDLAGTCQPRKYQGQACTNPDTENQCASGLYCVDGVCCTTRCDGSCQHCNSSGMCIYASSGTDPRDECELCQACNGGGACVNLGNGVLPVNSKICTANPPCGFDTTCDGSGNCRNALVSVLCGQDWSCDGKIYRPHDHCDGAGACADPSVDCGAYLCENDHCPTTCDADSDCYDSANNYCNGSNQCVSKKTAGTACGSAHECLSNFCVDGVCCNTACNQTCESCAIAGHVGACTDYAINTDPQHECSGTCRSCNGAGACYNTAVGQDPESECAATDPWTNTPQCLTNGSCDGAGGCDLWENVPCGAARCQDNYSGVTSYRIPSKECNGLGSCLDKNATSCGVYKCNSTVCRTSCSADSHCVTGYYCDTDSQCKARKTQGTSCTPGGPATQCLSGFCVDGYCCNTACSETCKDCNVAGKLGTCSLYNNIAAGTDPQTRCSTCEACNAAGNCYDVSDYSDPHGECSNECDAGCNAGACQYKALGTACGSGSVCNTTTDVYNAGTECNGAGSCVAANADVDCAGKRACQNTSTCWSTCGDTDDRCTGTGFCKASGSCECGTVCTNGGWCNGGATCDAAERIGGVYNSVGVPLVNGTYTYMGSTVGAGDNYSGSCAMACGAGAPDRVYKLRTPAGARKKITASITAGNGYSGILMYIRYANCTTGAQVAVSATSDLYPSTAAITDFPLLAHFAPESHANLHDFGVDPSDQGADYYLFVDGTGGTCHGGDYTLTLTVADF